MNQISINLMMVLIKGIPEGLLSVLAIFMFTGTKVYPRKYFLISAILIVATYLIRFLPIALGVNTVLSLLILIISFQIVCKTQMSKMIRTIAAAACTFILIAVSEVFNMLLLTAIYDRATAESLLNSEDGITQSVYSIPSTVFFGIFVLIGFLVIKIIRNRKMKYGDTGKKTGP
ncbi:MAG: hypothetical protein GXX89_05545 [Clostridiales bacterium]|nr:hypothetical protein [Clostridiales bacterium]